MNTSSDWIIVGFFTYVALGILFVWAFYEDDDSDLKVIAALIWPVLVIVKLFVLAQKLAQQIAEVIRWGGR